MADLRQAGAGQRGSNPIRVAGTRCFAGTFRDARRAVAMCSTIGDNLSVARTIPQRELRNDNAKIIEAVTAGETFIVTRNGVPVAELRPVRPIRRTFIDRDEIASAAGAVRIDHRQFRADLDRVIDQSL